MASDISYCQRCANALSEKTIEDRTRPYCPSCGYVVFLDPKVAAVVVLTMQGKLVLVRRGVEPAIGRWSFPSGYVDRGEVVEAAAAREVKEETGLDVQLNGLLGLYSQEGDPVILAVFAGEAVGGTMQHGHDAEDVALFDPEDLPPLPFPHDEQILNDWRRFGHE